MLVLIQSGPGELVNAFGSASAQVGGGCALVIISAIVIVSPQASDW